MTEIARRAMTGWFRNGGLAVWRFAVVGSVLLGAASCGGGKTDVRTRSGEIAFTGTTAYFFTSTGGIAAPDAGATPVNVLVLEVHESAEGCGPWTGVVPPTRSVMSIYALRQAPSSVSADQYSISERFAPDQASVVYEHQEASGGILLLGVSGALRLDHLGDTTAGGTVDVTLQGGTRIEGEFAASPCPR